MELQPTITDASRELTTYSCARINILGLVRGTPSRHNNTFTFAIQYRSGFRDEPKYSIAVCSTHSRIDTAQDLVVPGAGILVYGDPSIILQPNNHGSTTPLIRVYVKDWTIVTHPRPRKSNYPPQSV